MKLFLGIKHSVVSFDLAKIKLRISIYTFKRILINVSSIISHFLTLLTTKARLASDIRRSSLYRHLGHTFEI